MMTMNTISPGGNRLLNHLMPDSFALSQLYGLSMAVVSHTKAGLDDSVNEQVTDSQNI